MSTLLELETEVAQEIGSINAVDDKAKIDRELNRAVRRILREPPYLYIASQTVTPGANLDYALASSVLVVKSVYFTQATTDYDLEPLSLDDILMLRRGDATTGGPARYYALAGNKLAFYPAPGAADTLTMYYVPAPTAMSADAHDPSTATYGPIPVDYHDLIARYAMARMASFADDQSAAQGARYWQEFNEGLREMKRNLHRFGGGKLPRARLANRRVYPSDPAVVIR